MFPRSIILAKQQIVIASTATITTIRIRLVSTNVSLTLLSNNKSNNSSRNLLRLTPSRRSRDHDQRNLWNQCKTSILSGNNYNCFSAKTFSTMSVGKVLVYGGRGALGAGCVSHFKANNWWVGSIDLIENEQADCSIVVPRDATWEEQEIDVLSKVGDILKGEKLDAIICVAGGWAGGNAKKDLAKNSDLMWKQSVWTSTISAAVAAQYLKNGGLLALTGAKPALKGTPGMIGYGMAKAAVHQLTKSLAGKDSGLPDGSLVVAILPITLDTPMNRKWMPKGDFSTWTPLSFVAELFMKWTKGEERPSTGALLQLVTKDSNTSLVSAEEK